MFQRQNHRANVLMERTSEYFDDLSAEAKARYKQKLAKVGLKDDPYAIPNDLWVEEPPSVPKIAWSDMFLYMISTPSVYTKEEMKVWFHLQCMLITSKV